MLNVKIKRLSDTAIMPTYGSTKAAGMDLYADLESTNAFLSYDQEYINGEKQRPKTCSILPHCKAMVSTGVAMAIPDGYVGLIFARSGIACKKDLRPSNCVGVIDSDYRGNIMVCLHNDSDTVQTFDNHDRIAQMIIMPYPSINLIEVDELESTERGSGGFGSTGN